MKYYKALGKDGQPCNGGSGKYHLPTKKKDGSWKPGKWMPVIKGDLELCVNGYHLCRPQDLIKWLNEEIYEAEYKGQIIKGDDKIVVSRVRLLRRVETWNGRTAREFACWCVRNTPLENDKTTWDLLTDKSRDAVRVAEKYARGEATDEELAAARAAARGAARAAAWAAARGAAGAAVWTAARAAARDAAGDVAWAAAGAAARDAAWAAQTKHLLFEILQETGVEE